MLPFRLPSTTTQTKLKEIVETLLTDLGISTTTATTTTNVFNFVATLIKKKLYRSYLIICM